MTTIKIYIPRILGSVTESEILSVFPRMDIGKVTDIDMKYKINENNNRYYYAFISIKLYSTLQATKFKANVSEYGMIRLLYDEEAAQYWEIKHHVDRNKRVNLPDLKNVPFFRYITLSASENENKENENKENNNTYSEGKYKPYNMWETPVDLLNERAVDFLC